MTDEQREAWSALQKQIDLGMEHEWEEMEAFLHPSLSIWGDTLPNPVAFSAKAYRYFTKLEDESDEVISHLLVPVSVSVTGDVAIINAYHHVATKDEDGETEETVYRLHNTWARHEGTWKLLATYNTMVPPNGDDD